MSDRVAADRWPLDQFVTKAREIRRRLLRWHESLPRSVGLDIEHHGQRVRVVRWDDHAALSGETFRSRLNAGHGMPCFTLVNKYVPGTAGPIERDGQFSSDQTEYVLRDFCEHLAGNPTLELLRAAFGVVLDLQVFSVQPLGVPVGQTIGTEDIRPGVTPWVVTGTKVDPQILNELVEAAEKLAGSVTVAQLTAPTAKTERGDLNCGAVDQKDLPQPMMIVKDYHDNSINFHGNAQGSNVAVAGSKIADSSANHSNSENNWLAAASRKICTAVFTWIRRFIGWP